MAKHTTATKTTAPQQETAGPAPTGNLPAQQTASGLPPHPLVQFREYVQQRMATLEDALPPTIPPKRFVSVVMMALQTKPDLLKCTFPSLWNACVRAAQDGLLPDGREGAIAPYGESANGKRVADIATWMPMIAGYRKKIFEGGQVKTWRVEVVLEKDDFDYDLAEQKIFKHHRPLGNQDPGGVVGAYSIAKLANDETVLEVMSAFQIMQVKAKSKAASGPWSDQAFFPEMCKKVVGRRHYKQLPHHESMDAMIARDDQEHGLLDPADTPPIARPERRAISTREIMDQYADGAGITIDHDAETGEVNDNHDQVRGNAQTETRVEPTTGKTETNAGKPVASGEAGQDAAGSPKSPAASDKKDDPISSGPMNAATGDKPAVAEGGAASSASDTSSETTRDADRSGASPGGGEAGAAGPSTLEGSKGGSAATLDDDQEQVDGADRSWPPGAVPESIPEYERYHATRLAEFRVVADIPTWWNADNPLRKQLGLLNSGETEATFKRLRNATSARVLELEKAQG